MYDDLATKARYGRLRAINRAQERKFRVLDSIGIKQEAGAPDAIFVHHLKGAGVNNIFV